MQEVPARGKRLGLKEIDDWLTTGNGNPKKDTESDYIFSIEVEPFELSLRGEKREIEVIDFFVNANTKIQFFLKSALQNDSNFELRWTEELAGKRIGFSENRPNVLVVDSVALYFETKQNWTAADLEIDWENISTIDGGLCFSLTSPKTISLNQHNFTHDKVFWHPAGTPSKYYDYIKQRLAEWKSAKKPFILSKIFVSFDNWLSVKESKNLYVCGKQGQKGETELTNYLSIEINFMKKIPDWLKLPYSQREKFIKRFLEGDEEVESMKDEIQTTIRNLKNDNSDPKQENPAKTNSSSELPWKMVIIITFFLLNVLVIIILSFKRRKK